MSAVAVPATGQVSGSKGLLMKDGVGFLPLVVLVGGLVISLLVSLWLSRLDREVRQHALDLETDKGVYAVQQEVVQLAASMNAAAAYVAETADLKADQFNRFATTLFAGMYPVRAVVLTEMEHRSDMDAAPTRTDAPGAGNCAAGQQFAWSAYKIDCTAVYQEENSVLHDEGSAVPPELLKALEQAGSSGHLTVSEAPVEAGRGNSRSLDSRYFIQPVRQSAVTHSRGPTSGNTGDTFLVAEVSVSDLKREANEKFAADLDRTRISGIELLPYPAMENTHRRLARNPGDTPVATEMYTPTLSGIRRYAIAIGGQEWQLVITPNRQYGSPVFDANSLAMVFIGFSVSFLLYIYVVNITRKRNRSVRLLENSKLELEAVNNALKVEIGARESTEIEIRKDLASQTTISKLLDLSLQQISLDEMLEKALDLVLEVPWLTVEAKGSIFTADESGDTLIMRAQRGLAPPLLVSCAKLPFGHCLCGQAAASREVVFANCLDHRHEITFEGIQEHGHICTPILSRDKTVGVLNLYVEQHHQRDELEGLFLKMAADTLAGVIVRKQAEMTMATSLLELNNQQLAIDQHALVTITDPDGLITYANDSFCELMGYTHAELIGKTHRIVKSGRHLAEFYAGMWKTITQGQIWESEMCDRSKDGRYYWFKSTIVPFLDNAGQPYKYVAIRTDITRQKAVEEDLRAQKHEVEQAHMELERTLNQLLQSEKLASIGQLAAGIAHEINTPTQFISDNTRFLKESFDDLLRLFGDYAALLDAAGRGAIPEELVEKTRALEAAVDVEYIVGEIPLAISQSLEGVERIAKIVRSMKEFSHPGTEDKIELDINQAIESTITISRNEWKYCAQLETAFDDKLPLVPCLPGEFNQVILNIIVNAAHAIKEAGTGVVNPDSGTITVSTRNAGDYAEIRISDTGTGITEAIRTRIFDPFFTTKGVGRGTGQGLAIAYSVVVEKHGGSLQVESDVGRGSTFIIRLPFVATQSAKEQLHEQAHTVCR